MPSRALRTTLFLGLALAFTAFAQSPKEVRRVAKQGVSALPELARFLLNPDLKVRLEAVRSIIDIGGPRTLDPLVDATRDNDPQVQVLAVNGLVNFYWPGYVRTGFAAGLRKVSAQLRSRFSDPDDVIIDPYIIVRPEVISAIGRVARSGASLDARATAARAVGVLRGKQAIPDLIEALRSRDSDVILESLVALQKIRDSKACPGIHYLVNDLDEKVQIEAVSANGVLNCREAKDDLRAVLQRTDRDKVREAALSAVAMMAEPRDRALFANYVNSPADRLRIAAAEGFARLASIDDAHQMQALYDAETRNLPRLALSFALVMEGNLTMTEFAPLRYLIYSLNNAAYRDSATAYLTEAARNPEILRALYGALTDGTRDEKIFLARVIGASGDQSSVKPLEALSADPDAAVAQEGVRQLRNLQSRI